MPSINVDGLPSNSDPERLTELEEAIVTAIRGIKRIDISDGRPLPVFFHRDLNPLKVEKNIIVSIQALFRKICRDSDVRNDLCETVLTVIRTWANIHAPQCTYIEIQLDHPYDKKLGHAEWRKETSETPNPS